MRCSRLFLVFAAATPLAQAAAAEPAHTTRIETRPYYGAVVTVEHGVRVFRPLPPTDHLIINPEGATPLVIGAGSASVGAGTAPAEPAEQQQDE
jgi:hypothetical protein